MLKLHFYIISTVTFLTVLFFSNRFTEDKNGFTSLFNGKNLTGWGYQIVKDGNVSFVSFDGKTETNDKRFQVIDGILIANPNDYAKTKEDDYINVWTKNEYPGNFELTIEFRASKKADSGIFLRGVQLQCRDYLLAGPYKNLKNYKPQKWNKIKVTVKDNVAHCTCNGEVLEEALKLPPSGAIGLEADFGRMEFRNIFIRYLN